MKKRANVSWQLSEKSRRARKTSEEQKLFTSFILANDKQWNYMEKILKGFAANQICISSRFFSASPVCPWTTHLPLLHLRLHSYKMVGIAMPTSQKSNHRECTHWLVLIHTKSWESYHCPWLLTQSLLSLVMKKFKGRHEWVNKQWKRKMQTAC